MKRYLLFFGLFLAAWYVAGIDQHARHATVWAQDGRVWQDVAIDRTILSDLIVTQTSGKKIILSHQAATFAYQPENWYLGPFAWSAIAVALFYAAYTIFVDIRRLADLRLRSHQ